MENNYSLSPTARFLKKHGMHSAALFYQSLNETLDRRAGRTTRFHLDHLNVPTYQEGQRLFVTFRDHIAANHNEDDVENYGCQVDWNGVCYLDATRFGKLAEKVENAQERYSMNLVMENASHMYHIPHHIRYAHGGWHHTVDFRKLFKQGLKGYQIEIQEGLMEETDEEKRQFLCGMEDTLIGLIDYVERYKAYLKTCLQEKPEDPCLKGLVEALERVPFEPPTHFYEAFIMHQASMYFGNAFETGRLDDLLYPYYEKDLVEGLITREEAKSLIRELFEDIEKRIGHPGAVHVTIGGTDASGQASYNALTLIVIEAIRGLRTPNVTLRVRKDMPKELWEAFLENIGKGYGQPAIVNEELFLKGLVEQYYIPFEDAVDYVMGGCSEMLIQGKTMCDSTWVSYNMLEVFEDTFYNQFLNCDSFEAFYEAFKKDLHVTIQDMGRQINIRQHTEGLHMPTPLISLLTGGCLENRKSVLGGGASYNFDSTDIYGSTNAINALYTVREFYKGTFKDLQPEAFLESFATNYEGREEVLRKCQGILKFGNGGTELEHLAHEVMGFVFDEVKTLVGYRGNGQFTPAIIGWIDWMINGEKIGATPDGRKAGEPLADSAGPMQGTDTQGPTATLGAALSIPQEDCLGTCIVNLRLDPKAFKTAEGRMKVEALLKTYFAEGGNQLQINVVDQEKLEQALKEPDKHRDIIVRVGGFSDQFVCLDPSIQASIMQRIVHG